MPPRRRRAFRKPEQLSFNLVMAPPPIEEVERIEVGHFVGIRLSDGTWQLTVAPEKHSYLAESLTPQRWWKEAASEEFTLHSWSDCRTRIIGDRDDAESDPRLFELRAVATRWLRSFNEAFQTWRMSLSW